MSTIEIKQKLTSYINSIQDENVLLELYQMVCDDTVEYQLSESKNHK